MNILKYFGFKRQCMECGNDALPGHDCKGESRVLSRRSFFFLAAAAPIVIATTLPSHPISDEFVEWQIKGLADALAAEESYLLFRKKWRDIEEYRDARRASIGKIGPLLPNGFVNEYYDYPCNTVWPS